MGLVRPGFVGVLVVVVCGVAHPAEGSASRSDVLITEVYYCHGPVDDRFEWIELFNASVVDIPLEGYRLLDRNGEVLASTRPALNLVLRREEAAR